MTTKKTSTKKTQSSGDASSLQLQLKACQNKLREAQHDLQEKQDKLLRAYADIQNLYKRMDRDRDQRDDEVKRKYLLELVEIKELLEKASQDPNPHEGIKAIVQNLNIFFDKEEITSIDCLGKPFDHTCHYALSTQEQDTCKDGEILEEVKKGYRIKDKVLRPSHVIVAKKKQIHEQEDK